MKGVKEHHAILHGENIRNRKLEHIYFLSFVQGSLHLV